MNEHETTYDWIMNNYRNEEMPMLPTYLRNCLRRGGVNTIEKIKDVYDLGGMEVFEHISGMGSKSREVLQEAIDDGLLDTKLKKVHSG